MKKVFAVSILAILATGAANAEIASKGYVDKHVGTVSNLTTTDKTNTVAAINELVTTVAGAKTDLEGQITSAVGSAKTELQNAINQKADKSELDAYQTVANMNKSTLSTTSDTTYASEKTVADAIAAEISKVTTGGLKDVSDKVTGLESKLSSEKFTGGNGVTVSVTDDAISVTGAVATANGVGVVKPGTGLNVAADGALSVNTNDIAGALAESDAITGAIDDAIEEATTDMATKTWVEGKKYLTEHQSLAEYVKGSEMTGASAGGEGKYVKTVSQTNGKVTATEGTLLDDVKAAGFYTKTEVDSAIDGIKTGEGSLGKQVSDLETKVDGLEESKQDKLSAGNGIDIDDDTVSVKIKSGSKLSADTNGLDVDLSEYVTNINLNTTLNNYVTSEGLDEAVGDLDYLKESDLTDYAKTSEVENKISTATAKMVTHTGQVGDGKHALIVGTDGEIKASETELATKASLDEVSGVANTAKTTADKAIPKPDDNTCGDGDGCVLKFKGGNYTWEPIAGENDVQAN